MQATKVLIVDAETEFASLLADRLHSWGFAATAANNNEEALEVFPVLNPEVVLLGLKGKDQKGLDLVSMIKALNPETTVLLLIGKGAAMAGMLGMERGAADCISLPIELGLLIDRIRQASGAGAID